MKLRALILAGIVATLCHAADAQDLEVTRSPASPAAETTESGTAFDAPLVAFRLAAYDGAVDVDSLRLTLACNDDFTAGVSGLEAWLDDGDGVFDDGLDQLLWSGAAQVPDVTAQFTTSVSVASGTTEDVWIVGSFFPHAGSSMGTIYQVSITDADDVSTGGGATRYIGVPVPTSRLFTLIDFNVTGMFVNCDFGRVTVFGSGFTPPLQVYLDGAPAGGNVTVNQTHTTLTWSFGISQDFNGQELQIYSGVLGLKDTGRTIDEEDCSGGDSSRDDDDDEEEPFCSTDDSLSLRPTAVLVLLLLIVAARRLRRGGKVRV